MTRTLTDAQLVRRCREGDQRAWSELVDRYSRFVYAILVRGFRMNEDDSAEVFQEVFTRTFRTLNGLRDESALRPWLAQLTRRVAIDRMRASPQEDLVDELPQGAELDATIAGLEEALAVREALRTLPQHCQDVLERFVVCDESYETIADALGVAPGTVASRIARCREKLKHEYLAGAEQPAAEGSRA